MLSTSLAAAVMDAGVTGEDQGSGTWSGFWMGWRQQIFEDHQMDFNCHSPQWGLGLHVHGLSLAVIVVERRVSSPCIGDCHSGQFISLTTDQNRGTYV